jgi:hypothetical protein
MDTEQLKDAIRKAVNANNDAKGACLATKARLQAAIDAYVNRGRS